MYMYLSCVLSMYTYVSSLRLTKRNLRTMHKRLHVKSYLEF